MHLLRALKSWKTKSHKHEKRIALGVWAIVAACFFFKELALIHAFGRAPLDHADGHSEQLSRTGARNFVEKGPGRTYFLPVWTGFRQDTSVDRLKDENLYTHYFPGPDYVLAGLFAVFGNRDAVFQWGRLVPLLQLFIIALLFTRAVEIPVFRGWVWGKALLAALIFSVPAMGHWAIAHHGHAYSTACILAGVWLGIGSANLETTTRRRIWTYLMLAFSIGFISNYMLLTGAFVVCAAPLIGALLVHRRGPDFPLLKSALTLSLFTGLGLVASFVLHLAQIAWYLHSWSLAWEDQIGTALERMNSPSEGPTRLMLIGQYSDYVWRFFRVSSIFMLLGGACISWLHLTEGANRRRLCLALLTAFVASYLWVMFLKAHSQIHTHVNPRIFMLLYVTWACALVSLIADHALLRRQKLDPAL